MDLPTGPVSAEAFHKPAVDRLIVGGGVSRSCGTGWRLCKTHHSAYDNGILGVSPDLRAKIRSDILDEIDGPLLEHGLRGLHGQPLRVVPSAKKDRPDRGLSIIHYQGFTAS